MLTEEGFSYWGTFGERCVRWSDVLGFYRINKTQVGWKYATYFHEHAIARSLSSTLTGVDAGLPEVVGLSMEQQLELMNRLREQYASRDWPVARAVQSTV